MNEEEAKNLNCDNIGQIVFEPMLAGFHIENPTDYFKDQSDNVDLVCNTLNELNFLMSTLEIFGLPKDYL